MQKLFPLFVVLIAIIIFSNFQSIRSAFNIHLPFSTKEKVIERVINLSAGEKFNIYYQMPPGIDKGYRYIFKWKGNTPIEGANNLFILDYNIDGKFDPTNYYITYQKNDIYIEHFGSVYIVSVKL